MKVLFFTEGTRVSPASRIRVFEYLDRLGKDGSIEPRVVSFTSELYTRRIVAGEPPGLFRKIIEKGFQLGAILRFIAGSAACRVIFIQRVLLPVFLQKIIRLMNRRIIYDFDDAVYLGKPARKARFASQVSRAARVIAVSRAACFEAIAHGASEEKVSVLPSPVDCQAFNTRTERQDETFTVGWIGSPATTGYLENIWPHLAGLAGDFSQVRFLFIGASFFETGRLSGRTRFEPWSRTGEKELLCQLDVGLMPLEDDDWCRGKGGYKLIQYMAAGAACLATPVGANLEIVEEGCTGFFVRSPEEWGVFLRRLLEDPGLTARLGRAGRVRAMELYDYSVTLPRFAALLEKAGK